MNVPYFCTMMLRHSIIYFFSRGCPGIIAFFAIAIYTRLLSPQEYGRFALVIAWVGLFNSVIFHWLRLGVSRFWVANEKKQVVFLSTLAVGFAAVLTFALLFGWLFFLVSPKILVEPKFFALGRLLLSTQAWFGLNLELLRARFSPVQYGLLFSSKAVGSLALGSLFAYLGWGAAGLVAGVFLGTLLPALSVTFSKWRVVRFRLADFSLLIELLRYGLPITVAFVLNFVVSTSDRLLIGWLLGLSETGLYSVAYDLSQQTIGVLCMITTLSTYPIVVRALERDGPEAARRQLNYSAILMFYVAIPAVMGLVVLAPNIVEIIIGSEFQETATVIVPWIALAAFLGCTKSHYMDRAFSLSKRTLPLIWPAGSAAILNVLLNLWLIPQYRTMGAVYSTVISYSVALVLSWRLGKEVFYIPIPKREILKISLATLVMGLALWPLVQYRGLLAIIFQIFCGGGVYVFLTLFLNVGGMRNVVYRVWREKVKALG